jgi:hypothetical protein
VSVKGRPQTEREFQTAVVEYARLLGWKVFHPFDSRRSEPGWPDLAMARNGQLILAELKTERGRVSRDQQRWLDALGIEDEPARRRTAALEWRRPRLMVCLWRPSMWGEIEEILR